MSFAENLKKRRLELKLSQEELAHKVGYKSKSSIARLELGQIDISRLKLQTLANALEITLDDLMDEKVPQVPNNSKYKNIVIIQAGGKSVRNMMNVPNQFINVDDKPIIAYVMDTYQKHPAINDIYVSCLFGWETIVKSYAKRYGITKLKAVVTGGKTILSSTKNALQSISNAQNNDRIILQESTRPLISQALISKLLSAFEKYGNSVLVKAMSDYVTMRLENSDNAEYLERSKIYTLESPEIYAYQDIFNALKISLEKKIIDDNNSVAMLMHRLGMKLHYCESNSNNIKIIRQEDIYIFKTLQQVVL